MSVQQCKAVSSKIYSPHPLLTSRPDIRLVVIHPSTDSNGPIRCSLRAVCLDSDPQYEALSYRWGDAKITADIMVENTVLAVTTNLAAALQQLRQKDNDREMWIDAICINQVDNFEKKTQIPLMRAIYSNSACVVIWLGPQDADATSRDAFHFLSKAAEKYGEGSKNGFLRLNQENNSLLASALGRTGPHFILDKPILPASLADVLKPPEAYHRAAVALLCRDWFRRVWIIQEVAFARSAVVLCGRDSMSWDAFINGVRLIEMAKAPLYQYRYQNESGVAPQFFLSILSRTRDTIMVDKRCFTIRDAMRRFAPFESSLPRDKVFALRGLLHHPEAIDIDYDEKVPDENILRRAAARAAGEVGDLSLLLDRHEHEHDRPGNVPSWFPDWFTPGSLGRGEAVSVEDRFCASGGMGKHTPARFVDDDRRLLASGYVIDQIARLGRRRPSYADFGREYWPKDSRLPRKDPYGIVVDSCEALRHWMMLSGCLDEPGGGIQSAYATGETLDEVFWQTFLRPDLSMGAGDDSKWRDFEAALRMREWMFMSMDWFVRRIDRQLHWAVIWSLFSVYLWAMGLALVINLACGRLRWAPEYTTPVDPDQSNKVMARTAGGLLAFVPATAQVDDRIVLVRGATRPCVLRSCGKDWKFVGSAYVHGIMYGAAFDAQKCVSISII